MHCGFPFAILPSTPGNPGTPAEKPSHQGWEGVRKGYLRGELKHWWGHPCRVLTDAHIEIPRGIETGECGGLFRK